MNTKKKMEVNVTPRGPQMSASRSDVMTGISNTVRMQTGAPSVVRTGAEQCFGFGGLSLIDGFVERKQRGRNGEEYSKRWIQAENIGRSFLNAGNTVMFVLRTKGLGLTAQNNRTYGAYGVMGYEDRISIPTAIVPWGLTHSPDYGIYESQNALIESLIEALPQDEPVYITLASKPGVVGGIARFADSSRNAETAMVEFICPAQVYDLDGNLLWDKDEHAAVPDTRERTRVTPVRLQLDHNRKFLAVPEEQAMELLKGGEESEDDQSEDTSLADFIGAGLDHEG